MLPRQGSGHLQSLQQPAALDPEQVGDRAGLAEIDQRRMDPALQRGLVLDQVQAEAGELTLLADARVGQPDRRHQVAVTEHRKDLRVDLVGLAGQRRETLDLLGVSDLDRPALLLEGVVDDPRASHRLDHGADRLAVDLLDAASEPSKRVDVGRYGELVQMLSLIGEQTHVELLATQIQSSVQHVNGPPRGWFSMTSGACHRGGPPSWQSEPSVSSKAGRTLANRAKMA